MITYLGEDASARTANNTTGVRTYNRRFRFHTTSKTDDCWDIGSHASAPNIGDVFHDAWCRSITVTNSDPYAGWLIDAEYSSERELFFDPTTDPAIITISTEQFQKVADQDIAGNGITNSAGDPFDPPYMMDDSRRVINIQKNITSYPEWLLNYADAVNSDEFTVMGMVYGIGKAKVQRVSISEKQMRNGFTFVVLSIEIHLQKDGWLCEPLDVGFRDKVAALLAQRKNATNDGDGQQPSAPIPLDGTGIALTNPSSANAVFLSYQIYYSLPFSVLPLT